MYAFIHKKYQHTDTYVPTYKHECITCVKI